MKQNSVFAVIVTYNPDYNLEMNISAVKKQVETLLVIDNNSNPDALSVICGLQNKLDFELIKNEENKGIAAALNQGLAKAEEGGFNFFLTMDQDTLLNDSAVEIMLSEMGKYDIASIGPMYNPDAAVSEPQEINFLISSGNLTKTQIAIEAGGFDEWMFIDGVDIDFSLKMRALGYKIAQSKHAVMSHSIGKNETGRFLFIKIPIVVHTLIRYYYASRNNYYLRKKHKKKFPYYCFKLKIAATLKKIKIIFFYQNKREILKSIKKGRTDARKSFNKQK